MRGPTPQAPSVQTSVSPEGFDSPHESGAGAGSHDWDLAGWDSSLRLDSDALRLSRPVSLRPSIAIRYRDITHLAQGERGIWIATGRGVTALRRTQFARRNGPEALRDALLARIAREPGGPEQLARFAEIDQFSLRPPLRIAGFCVALVCLAVFTVQRVDPFAELAGAFIPSLVRQGEFWRVLTGNFFHTGTELPLHLGLNLIALLFLTVLVERPLGPARTSVVMGAAALGAMAASTVAGYAGVIGASGIVFGLVGAAFCLELQFAHRLPVWWRIPRPLVYLMLAWQGCAALLTPFVAGAAHIGGFAAGYLATWLLAAPALVRARPAAWVRGLATAFAFATAASFFAAWPLILGEHRALERHGRNLLATTDLPPQHFNDLAWRFATEHDPTATQLSLAVELAERAVDAAARLNPDWLDTLAEALFVSGQAQAAVLVIDEAIRLAPGVEYFREQRRRFLGERAPEDRPAAPHYPWPYFDLPEEPVPELGIEV